jgi:hypothetical protein
MDDTMNFPHTPEMKTINKRLKATREKKVFAVSVNIDLTEGRGSNYIYRLCENYSTAKRLSKGINVQGTDGKISTMTCYFLPFGKYDSMGLWYGPTPLIIKPNKEDLANEKVTREEEVKNTLFEKFKKGEDLTKEEREKIISFIS